MINVKLWRVSLCRHTGASAANWSSPSVISICQLPEIAGRHVLIKINLGILQKVKLGLPYRLALMIEPDATSAALQDE